MNVWWQIVLRCVVQYTCVIIFDLIRWTLEHPVWLNNNIRADGY